MSEAPFINFYTSDFLAGTGGMTAATKGVYITLLCLMYESEKPLSQSRDALARRCGCTVSSFEKALAALVDDGKMEVRSDGIWSAKCEKHITARRERRSSAKAAAEKRWQKIEEKQGNADARAHNPQCQPEPEPEIEKTPPTPQGDDPPAADRGPSFAEFWDQWPLRKQSKPAAESAFRRLSAQHKIAAVANARRWGETWRKEHPDLNDIHPATYLNKRRWEDEGAPAPRSAPSGPDTWRPDAVIPSQMFTPLVPPPKRRTA
jgi:uncharacterized protein YdaU (DUF1376 family)